MLRHGRIAVSDPASSSTSNRPPYMIIPTRSNHIYRTNLVQSDSADTLPNTIPTLVLRPLPPVSPSASDSGSESEVDDKENDPDKTVRLPSPTWPQAGSAPTAMEIEPSPPSPSKKTVEEVEEHEHCVAMSPSGRWGVGLTRRGLRFWKED